MTAAPPADDRRQRSRRSGRPEAAHPEVGLVPRRHGRGGGAVRPVRGDGGPAPRPTSGRSSWPSTSCATGSVTTATTSSTSSCSASRGRSSTRSSTRSRRSLHAIGWPALIALFGDARLHRRRLAAARCSRCWGSSPWASCRSGSPASTRSAPSPRRSRSRSRIGVPLGHPDGRQRPRPPDRHADPRRDADHADVRLPRPVRPALRDRARRRRRSSPSSTPCRRRSASRRSASAASRRTRSRPAGRWARPGRQLLTQGRAAAGPPGARPGAQPDDHAGPVDDRHHRPHRRPGPRPGHAAGARSATTSGDVRRGRGDRRSWPSSSTG